MVRALTPAFRVRHTDGNPGVDDYLWELPQPFRNATRAALVARLRLLPYRYTLSRVAHDTALGPVRPMYYGWPTAVEAYAVPQQYMVRAAASATNTAYATRVFHTRTPSPSLYTHCAATPAQLGDDLLVAPAYAPRGADGTTPVAVWLPQDAQWVQTSFGGTEAPEGGTTNGWANVSVPIDAVPVFARVGAFIPTLPAQVATAIGAAGRAYPALRYELFAHRDQAASTAWLYVCARFAASSVATAVRC